MSAPLAERLRPKTIDDYIGQEHLVGKNGVFRKFFETGNVPSFILWGPPGVGKTTLAKIVATQLERPFFTLSAVTSGVKDVREVIESAKKQRFFDAKPPFLFIDEIHRFNKSQQDSLLGAVEQGTVTLIGATTENPSFEVISPLLSRCQVYILRPMEDRTCRRCWTVRSRPTRNSRPARSKSGRPARSSNSQAATPANCSTSSTSSPGRPTAS